VRANPTLEDHDLRARLAATVRVHDGPGDGPRLRVVSNDDTDASSGGGCCRPGRPVTFADVGGLAETLLARATAGQCRATFLNVAIEDVLDIYIGESERKLHALFEKARASTPAVMFFDRARGARRQAAVHARGDVVQAGEPVPLGDGRLVKNNAGVPILAATNVPWAIDPAFRRPGRLDRVLFVSPPDRAARAGTLRILLGGRPAAAGRSGCGDL
jgi:SpoVK/Ycf46/Vps4 family AAA+-type ATPase